MSHWIYFERPADFLKFSYEALMKEEARHNLVLSAASHLLQNPDPSSKQKPFLASVADQSGFAVLAPGKPLLLTATAKKNLSELGSHLQKNAFEISEVLGPQGTLDEFFEVWAKPQSVSTLLRLHVWQKSSFIEFAPGQMRRAWFEEVDLIANWVYKFSVETEIKETSANSAKLAQALIATKRIFVWRDGGEIVAMAAFTGSTPNGVRVILVYTPPEKRKRGYARSLTLKLSELQRQLGKKFCVLFTDPAYPTSNKIYREIGYQPLEDFAHYRI